MLKKYANQLGVAPTQEQGLTLVEVLVASMVMLVFAAVAMQTLVMATAFKVKGQEVAEATTWMQEDVESARYQANKLDAAASGYTPDAGRCAPAAITAGYADKLRDAIATVENSGTPINITTPGNHTVAFGKATALTGRPYTMTRVSAIRNTAPYNVLTLTYSITKPGTLTPVATLYAEVIPDAAFSCS